MTHLGKNFALVDCNNFYVSCEQVFNPALRGRAVVVLSNNDGCIVSRSAEAKAMGITMAEPVFELRNRMRTDDIVMLSSNYTLYGDMSNRVMSILRQAAPVMEQYSIDEAFLDLSGIADAELEAFGSELRGKILQWTGLPTSIGIAPTRTLAKVANHYAKKNTGSGGVFNLSDRRQVREVLQQLTCGEVWGVGRALVKKFARIGIKTAGQLADTPPEYMRQKFGITVMRTVLELSGTACMDIESAPPAPAGITRSRSFSRRVSDIEELRSALAMHVGRAAEKLRSHNLLAGCVSVYMATSKHESPPYSRSVSATANLDEPTADTVEILRSADKILQNIYAGGYGYRKLGVMLTHLTDKDCVTPMLFGHNQRKSRNELMQTLDKINARHGGKINYARTTQKDDWEARCDTRTPSYTTNWTDLPLVR